MTAGLTREAIVFKKLLDRLRNLAFTEYFKSFSIYSSVNIFERSLPMLFLPILTRWLTPLDYGLIGTFNSIRTGVEPVVTMSTPGAVGRAYFDKDDQGFDYPSYVFTALIVNVVLFFLMGCIIFSISGFIVDKLHFPAAWLGLVLGVSFFTSISSMRSKLWIFQQQPIYFAKLKLSKSVMNLGLSIFLILIVWADWRGRISGIVLAELIVGIVALFLLIKGERIRPVIRWAYVKDVLRFGLPLYPHSLGWILIGSADKLLLNAIKGLSQLGIYNVAWAVASIIVFLGSAVDLTLTPWVYKMLKQPNLDGRLRYVCICYYYFCGITIMALLLGFFAPFLLSFFVGAEFQSAGEFVLLLSLANVAFVLYRLFSIPIYYYKRTHLLALVTLLGGIVSFGSNYLLIERYGVIGAVYGTMIGYFFILIVTWIFAHKLHPMPWLKGLIFIIKRNKRFRNTA